MKYNKEIILSLAGIILIVFGAFITSSIVNEEKIKKASNGNILKVSDTHINLKLYRVNKTFFIKVPDTFIKLDDQTLIETYPSNDRPELVFQSIDNTIHVFITMSNEAMTDDLLTTYVENRKKQLVNFKDIKTETYNKYDKTFGRLVATNQDSGIYYDLRFFTINDKLVKVEYNSTKDKKNDWMDVSEAILDSICFAEEDTKK